MNSIRWTRRVLATCAASTSVLIAGCDDMGEAEALNLQAQASALRLHGAAGADEAASKLQTVAASEAATPVVIQSTHALGQVKLAKARTESIALARLQSQAADLVFRIGQLARDARTQVTLASNYRQLDPKASVAAIDQFAAQTRGDRNASNFAPTPEANLPTLSVAQQEKSRLDGEVSRTQSAIESATSERDRLLSQAGELAAALEGQTGEARIPTATQIAQLRGQAAAASRQISDASSQLSRLQAEQAMYANVIAQLQGGVEALTGQSATLAQGWKSTTASADAQLALAKRLLQDENSESIRSLTQRLQAVQKEIDAKREEVETNLRDAVSQFSTAATRAGTLVQEINAAKTASAGNAYETQAWNQQATLLAVDRMNLDKAQAERALGDLETARAVALAGSLATAGEVEAVSEAINVPAADPFNTDKLKDELGKAVTAANEAYSTAIATLDGVTLNENELAALRSTKYMNRILALNSIASIGDLAKAHGVAAEVSAKSEQSRQDAAAAVAEAKEANVPLPSLPVSLGGTVPSTQPATTPADAPTDAPAAPDSPQAAEIRQSIRDLATRFTASPTPEPAVVDELFGRIKVNEQTQPTLDAARGLFTNAQRLQTAVQAKFGDEGVAALRASNENASMVPAGMKMPTPAEVEQGIASLRITTTDETHAEIAPPGGGQSVKLIKDEDGVWRVDLTELPPQAQMMFTMASTFMTPVSTAMAQVATDVEAGKYATVDEVRAALQAAMPQMPGMPGPGGGGTTTGDAPAPADAPAPQP